MYLAEQYIQRRIAYIYLHQRTCVSLHPPVLHSESLCCLWRSSGGAAPLPSHSGPCARCAVAPCGWLAADRPPCSVHAACRSWPRRWIHCCRASRQLAQLSQLASACRRASDARVGLTRRTHAAAPAVASAPAGAPRAASMSCRSLRSWALSGSRATARR